MSGKKEKRLRRALGIDLKKIRADAHEERLRIEKAERVAYEAEVNRMRTRGSSIPVLLWR